MMVVVVMMMMVMMVMVVVVMMVMMVMMTTNFDSEICNALIVSYLLLRCLSDAPTPILFVRAPVFI